MRSLHCSWPRTRLRHWTNVRWLPRRSLSEPEDAGFKTCADVEKAEQEGEVVIYATSPEQVALKCSPGSTYVSKIAPNYLRLQPGAYGEGAVRAQRRPTSSMRMQVSTWDDSRFSEEERLLALCLARDVAYNAAYKSEPVGYWTWINRAAGITYNPTTYRRIRLPRPGKMCSTRNDGHRHGQVSNSVSSMSLVRAQAAYGRLLEKFAA